MADKYQWLTSRHGDESHAGVVLILVLICLFLPILSLRVVWEVMNITK